MYSVLLDTNIINFIIPYSSEYFLVDDTNKISEIISKDYRLKFFLYGISPIEKNQIQQLQKMYPSLYFNLFLFSCRIDSCQDCGNIDKDSIPFLTLQQYFEHKLFNGCLNRKISIDENGNIKNCPSMEKNWGNIKNTKLSEVCQNKEFLKFWNITNDQIEGCRNCELRYLCSGCRAYIKDPHNLYSMPIKCKFLQNSEGVL